MRRPSPPTALRLALAIALAADAGAAQEVPVTAANVDAAIERGVEHLLAEIPNAAGEAGALGPGARPGLRALALYALLKCGAHPSSAGPRRLLRDLAFREVRGTYDVACMLMALHALGPERDSDWVAELATELVRTQNPSGGWGYPSDPGDVSNTQYAALGLAAAERSGFAVPSVVWQRLADALLRIQQGDGGFPYPFLESDVGGSTATMTAAGVGTLALCELALVGSGDLTVGDSLELASARARGLDWFAAPSFAMQSTFAYRVNYFLYGLERMGAYADLARVGGVDWYRAGASVLLSTQRPDGAFGGLSDTCFGLLFLRRASHATSPSGVSGTPSHGSTRGGARDAPVHLAADGEAPVRVWLHDWSPKELASYEWPDEKGRGPRIHRVLYLVDGVPVAVAFGDARKPGGIGRFEEAIELARPGMHRLQARVELALPPERAGGPLRIAAVSSPLLRIAVERLRGRASRAGEPSGSAGEPSGSAVEPSGSAVDALAIAVDLAASASDARASSQERRLAGYEDVTFDAARAVDARRRHPWLAEEDDRNPGWSVRLDAAVSASALRIWPARLVGAPPDLLARPVDVEVVVDQGRTLRTTVTFPSDPAIPVVLPFEGTRRVQRLELRILSADPPLGRYPVGFGEIELLAPPAD